MKKQFFYAAMAVALMASCTSEDNVVVDPVNPTPEEEKVAIELGIASNAMTIGSRGTGIVGGVLEGDEDPNDNEDAQKIAAAKKWDSQRLYVAMVNKKDGSEVKENGVSIFNGLEFRAPSSTAAAGEEETIRIYTPNGYNKDDDNGILQHKYYPVTGAYDFYGYHLDDAQGTLSITPAVDATSATATVTGITIDGTQDIMAAKTQEITDQSQLDLNPFSAKSARNNLKPILNFTHELARLKFHVRSGEGSDAAKNHMGEDGNTPTTRPMYTISNDGGTNDNWTGNDNDYTKFKDYLDGAIYVTDIKVLDLHENIKLDLVNQKAEKADDTVNDFTLRTIPETNEEQQTNITNGYDKMNLIPLKPVAPEYAWGYNGTPTGASESVNNTDGKKATPIGESIMFLPVGNGTDAAASTGTDEIIKIQVTLGQCLIDTENEATDPHAYTYYWDTPESVTLTLKADDLKQTGTDVTASDLFFAPGKSYNVYITIYGRERIEISATLEPWVEGGDINTDIEDVEE